VVGAQVRSGGPPEKGVAPDHSKPLGAPRWTEVVKAVLKRQAGVAFAPKDLRSSFITFLLSDANSDEALKKAVATAMRHSTAMQTSGAYDKDRAERTWASAVQVAGAYAARFE
jgi:integrase